MKQRFAVVSLSLLLILGIAGSSVALPPGTAGSWTTWYSDATFTTIVGDRYAECYSTPIVSGTRTRFLEYYAWDCQDYEPIASSCSFWICGYEEDEPSTSCNCYA